MMNMMNQAAMANAKGQGSGEGMAPMGMGGMAGLMSGAPSQPPEKKPLDPLLTEENLEIDPEVRELGDYFNIEERWIKRLNETMKKRKDTKEQDIAKPYEDVDRLARKFKLDDHVTSRLTELVVRRRSAKEEERAKKDLDRIEQHLRYCKRPSAMATLLAGKLLEGEVDELPDLREAEDVMEHFKLDEDAKSNLREIIEKRASDKDQVLAQVKKHLEGSPHTSSMLCKIARTGEADESFVRPPQDHLSRSAADTALISMQS